MKYTVFAHSLFYENEHGSIVDEDPENFPATVYCEEGDNVVDVLIKVNRRLKVEENCKIINVLSSRTNVSNRNNETYCWIHVCIGTHDQYAHCR